MTSRIELSPASRATMRSIPSAMPPWGGVPNDKACRKKPKRSLASRLLSPNALNTRCWMPGSWIRMEPLPNSDPFNTRS